MDKIKLAKIMEEEYEQQGINTEQELGSLEIGNKEYIVYPKKAFEKMTTVLEKTVERYLAETQNG